MVGGFPAGSDSKESTGNVGDLSSIPGLGRSRLCVCQASFFMTFVTSGMSLGGSRQERSHRKDLPEGGHVADCSEAGPRARAGRGSVGGLSCEPAA